MSNVDICGGKDAYFDCVKPAVVPVLICNFVCFDG